MDELERHEKRMRNRADDAERRSVIPDHESGQLGEERDLQWETQHDHGVKPHVPLSVHERSSSNEPTTPYMQARKWPRGWRN